MDPRAVRAPIAAPGSDSFTLPGLGDLADEADGWNALADALAGAQDLQDDPQPVANPTNFRRLYYNTTVPSPHLYRSEQNMDPRNHYELVDNPADAMTIVHHGQKAIVVDPRANIERMALPDLWQYLEYERALQHEPYHPAAPDLRTRQMLDDLEGVR